MTEVVISASGEYGWIYSQHDTYSVARAGNGSKLVDISGELTLGQIFVALTYYCYESFLNFDTSSIPDSATIDTVQLEMYLTSDQSASDFTIEVASNDYGSTLTSTDFVAGNTTSALTNVATLATSGIGATGAYKNFSEVGTTFRVTINKTGTTRLILRSNEFDDNSAPTGNEYVSFSRVNAPRLRINYTVTATPKSIGGTLGSMSGLLNKGGIPKSLTGTLGAVTGSLDAIRTYTKIVSGLLEDFVSGALTKSVNKPLSGVVGALTGFGGRSINQLITGTLGSMSGSVRHNLGNLKTRLITGGYAIINRIRGA